LTFSSRRAGFPINEDIGINLAKSIVNDEFLTFQGIYVHAGHSYDSKSVEDIEKFAEQERQCAIQFKQKLLDNGITPTIVSVGSTPTCSKSKSFEGINILFHFHSFIIFFFSFKFFTS